MRLARQRRQTGNPRRHSMKWHTPKIVEIACGGEINAYFPAEL
jgi:coenzyme PQQ precursor peptide PqqA